MEDCILVREKETEQRVILPLNRILSVLETDTGECFIETSVTENGESVGILAKDKFDYIMSILSKKILVN